MNDANPTTYLQLYKAVEACFGASVSFNIEVSTWRHSTMGKTTVETEWSIYDGEAHHTGATPMDAFAAFLMADRESRAEPIEDAGVRVNDVEGLPPECGHEDCK